ncbi:MAG: STAS domain-containing protein [Ferruginibacter sp.]|nr:STAS domain-containing protein [Ferruginibacter sp.]
MNVKIDTKEKFTVIKPIEVEITANMTEELVELLLAYLNKAIPHVILNMNAVKKMDAGVGQRMSEAQQQFYDNNCSFVVCALDKQIEVLLEKAELLELMNTTPTESEAWDILQMEEMERELLSDFDNNDAR